MYFSKNKHILSNTILIVSCLNILAEASNVLLRVVQHHAGDKYPAMLNSIVSFGQTTAGFLQIGFTTVVFLWAMTKIRHYRSLFPEEEEEEMAKLQREMIPDKVSTLTMRSTDILTKIWAVILIGINIIYEVTSSAYTRLITQLLNMVSLENNKTYQAFLTLYNSTHGFKYFGMMIAIILGIATTGIFLKDRFLIIVSGVLSVLFIMAFLLLQQSTILLPSGTAIGVVWTSVIYHLMETAGLLVMALYLRFFFKGL